VNRQAIFLEEVDQAHFMYHRTPRHTRKLPGWMKTELQLAKGVSAKFVTIRKVKNGFKVLINR
jgi:hypothetical protein